MGFKSSSVALLPNFIICGAQKSGSTSLYNYLRQHPQVFMPEEKEPNFFNFHYDRGIETYQKLFAGAENYAAIGEASIRYMVDPSVPPRLAEHLPEAKLIFVIRNPIDRAWSHYWFRLGKTEDEGMPHTGPSFSEVIRDPADPVKTVEWGMYHEHLTRFEKHHGRENMLVILSDDLRKKHNETMAIVYEFLGLTPIISTKSEAEHNVTSYPRNLELYRAARTVYRVVNRGMKALRVDALMKPFHKLRVATRTQMLEHNGKKPEMKPEDREYLRRIYAEPNRRLGEYLGRDLSHWV